MAARVVALRSGPVKGLGQDLVPSLELEEAGVTGDRRFVLVDAANRALYGGDLAALAGATSQFDPVSASLAITFADGTTVVDTIALGDEVLANAYALRPVPGVRVASSHAAALSARAGQELSLLMAPVGRGSPGPVTVISHASVARVGQALGVDTLDARRFRMNIEIDGVEAHAEDGWEDHDVQIGSAVVRIGGAVPRCVLMTRDPDTHLHDHDTLRAILSYRAPMAKGEPPLGVYATVVRPGRIAVGDDAVVVAKPAGGDGR